jgi:hypothetical protein
LLKKANLTFVTNFSKDFSQTSISISCKKNGRICFQQL